jgi:hypothetical protein
MASWCSWCRYKVSSGLEWMEKVVSLVMDGPRDLHFVIAWQVGK